MKHNNLSLALATVLVISAVGTQASAQSGPFAPGPVHPMSAPLDPNDANAKLDPKLLDAKPIQPLFMNRAVTSNEVIDHDVMSNTTKTSPASVAVLKDGTVSAGSKGSINLFGHEPNAFNGNGGAGVQSIIGADTRQTIWNASIYPWRTNAKIYMTFPDNSVWQGSCTLIAGKYALTAGHCVYSAANGGWAKRIQVIPGLSGSWQPYGSAYVTRMRTYTGWTVSGNNQYDMALVTLDRSIGNTTGWFGYGYWSNLTGVTGNLSAYDADINSTYQKYRYGTIYPDTNVIYYYFDTMPGSSGGGVYRMIGSDRYVMGDNNWQYGTVNMGVRITSGRFTDIKNWIASGI